MQQRVALVSSSYHPHLGGVETHVREVAKELRSLGTCVEVWTVDRGEHLGTTRLDGIVVRHLPTPLPARSAVAAARFLAHSPVASAAWAGAYRSFRPDVLHVQCFGPNGPYAVALSRLTRTPLVVSAHGETFMDDHDVFGTSALMRRSLKHALSVADATTGCSDQVVQDLRTRFGLVQGVVVPNGVGFTPRPRATTSTSSPAEPGAVIDPGASPTVFAVGRLEESKGFDLLLQAVAITSHPAGLQLVLAGSGSQRAGLERLASQLDIEARVRFVGPLDEVEVATWMHRSDLVVMPSRREAFGIVALEAWRSGTPLVATSLGGPSSFVRDHVDGLLVDPTDVAALSAAMTSVLIDPELAQRLASNGLRSVQDYTWSRTARNYLNVYDVVMAPASR